MRKCFGLNQVNKSISFPPNVQTRFFKKQEKWIIKVIGCCVSGMRKSAMITESETLQSNHSDTFFSI